MNVVTTIEPKTTPWVYLNVYNDHKEKHESYEAWDTRNVDIDRGYGADPLAAINNYLDNVVAHLRSLSVEYVGGVKFLYHSYVLTDYTGNPLGGSPILIEDKTKGS